MLEAEARERQRTAGAKNLDNFNKGLVGTKRSQLDSAEPRTIQTAAKAVGISPATVKRMKRITNEAPELVEKVLFPPSGSVALNGKYLPDP